MSDQHTPTRGVPVKLDRVRYLRYPLGLLEEIKREIGDDSFEQGFSGMKLVKMLWYGLRGDDPELTQEQVGDLVDLENLVEVTAALQKATGQKVVSRGDAGTPPTPSPEAAVKDSAVQ